MLDNFLLIRKIKYDVLEIEQIVQPITATYIFFCSNIPTQSNHLAYRVPNVSFAHLLTYIF